MRFLPDFALSGRKADSPAISLILPVYNNYGYLDECINSVIDQSLKNIEIIIVNDGSTDERTNNKLEIFAASDKRIKLINKQNTGYGNSMNIGIAIANGEYIGIVESDDYIHRNFYEKLYKYARKYSPDIIKANGYFFTGNGINRQYRLAPAVRNNTKKLLEIENKADFFRGIPLNQFGIFRKNFLTENNIKFSETPGASFQDIGFYFKTAILAKKILILNEPLYFVRRDNEHSSVKAKDKIECPVYEYAQLEKFLNADEELKKQNIKYLHLRKFFSYKFTLGRLGPQYKKQFRAIFSREWLEAENRGEIDYSLFTQQEINWLNSAIFNR